MKSILIFLIHAVYWALYLTVVTTVTTLADPRSSLILIGTIDVAIFKNPYTLVTILTALTGFYTAYFFLFEKFLAKKRLLWLLFWMAAISFATAAITLFVPRYIIRPEHFHITPSPKVLWAIGSHTALFTFIHQVLGLAMNGFITSYSDLRVKAELKTRNQEMELALIRSQTNPHFLFNTINNIDVLIQKDPAKASEYLNKLSDILRFMLYEAGNEKIDLQKELDYIEKYIALQRIRTSNPGFVTFEVKGKAGDLLTEPMLFVPFLENAFKHSENKKAEGAVKIYFNIERDRIVFTCENVYSGENQTRPGYAGLGNELIRRRLELLYPQKHRLEISGTNGIYKVDLSITL